MPACLLPQPFHKILVVGAIYDQMDKLSVLSEMIPRYDFTIFNGGLCYPSGDLEQVRARISAMNLLISQTQKVIYLAGRSDYVLYHDLEAKDKDISDWIRTRPNLLMADFESRSVLVMDGGLSKNIENRMQLQDNLEASFISGIEGKPWHNWYAGGLGYVISNNPMTSKKPQYYNYSMQLGCTSALYAQEVDEVGLKQTILL